MQALQASLTESVERTRLAEWLQILSHVSPEHGGIATSVPQLARATESNGPYRCSLVGFCRPEEVARVPEEARVPLSALPPDRIRWLWDTRLRSPLKERIRQAAGLHIHGIWETHSVTAASLAQSCKRPYIVSAHGMLERWALGHKRLRKAFYAAIVETKVLSRASCLRALTPDEVDDYRRLGLRNPIAIVPSGIDPPEAATPALFREVYPHIAGKRLVLFLGRIHYKKGLHLLLQGWRRIAAKNHDVHLIIAGPDSENTLTGLRRMTEEFHLQSSVTFAGMISGPLKWSALAAADLFVLPSYSEGFSIAVLEALAMGVPVIVSLPCHVPEVAHCECGWVIQPQIDPLVSAVEEFLRLSPRAIAEIGSRGRDLVERRFRWPVIGKQMADVYGWLQGGPLPSLLEIA